MKFFEQKITVETNKIFENFFKIFYTAFLTGSCTQFDPLNIFLYGKLHIILKPRNVKICEHSIFVNYWTKVCLKGHWNFGVLLIVFGVNCSIGFINSDN